MWCYVHADRYTVLICYVGAVDVVVDIDSGVGDADVYVGVDFVATFKLMRYKSMYLRVYDHIYESFTLFGTYLLHITDYDACFHCLSGFVIEGREDDELPETMFACVAVNKPQEQLAEFLFDDDDDDDAY